MVSRRKFQIQDLFEDIYNNHIPEYLFQSNVTTFADLQSAGLQSIIPIVDKLRENGHSDDNIRTRVYAFMENEVYLNSVMGKYPKLPVTFDIYSDMIDMKFDVVVGNPPYQIKVGPQNNEPIWNKFVLKSFDVVKQNGYVSLIHPSGWRSSTGRFVEIKNLLTKKNIEYLNLNDFNKGAETFGVGTNYDYYVVKNSNNSGNLTIVNDTEDKIRSVNLNDYDFIPNCNFELFENVFTKDLNNRVEIIHSESKYAHRKTWMSKELINEYVYPCVYTITQKSGINLYYSTTNQKGHFGIPKVIVSNGLGSYPVLDQEGQYGVMEYSFGIADSVDNLVKIQTALESDKFLKLMSSVKFTNNKYERRVIATFKKDFWKEFIDE